MKRIGTIFLLIALLISGCGKRVDTPAPTPIEPETPNWQEQYDLGIRFLSEGNYAEAIIAFTAAIEIDPKQSVLYIGRADAYIASGETEENLSAALADFEFALSLDESLVDAWMGLADVYIRHGDYDKALNILKEALNKTNNSPSIVNKIDEIEKGKFIDSSGKVRRKNSYNENSILVWYHTYTYNEHGQRASITSYDAQNHQTGHIDILYNEAGNPLTGHTYDDSGCIRQTSYEYDETGKLIKEIYYTSSGEKDSYYLYQYDSNGNRIRSSYHFSTGTLDHYRISEYDSNGKNIKDMDYNADGNLYSYYTKEYNETGNRTIYCKYDGYGNLKWREITRFDNEGKKIGTDKYDGHGNLIQSTVNET